MRVVGEAVGRAFFAVALPTATATATGGGREPRAPFAGPQTRGVFVHHASQVDEDVRV